MPLDSNAYFLSEADRSKFSELWKEHYRMYGHPKQHPEDQEYQAPEFYVAKTPTAGIAGIVGTQISYATCVVYQLVGEGNKAPEAVDGHEIDVYNISQSSIAGGSWVLVARDKYGVWHVIVGGGSSGFWAELTYKILMQPPHYTEYYAVKVVDVPVTTPPVHWQEVADSEGDDGDPDGDVSLSGTGTAKGTGTSGDVYADVLLCYEVNNTDIPYVPTFDQSTETGSGSTSTIDDPYPPGSPYGYQRQIVWLTPGSSSSATPSGTGTGTSSTEPTYYLFEINPRWEPVQRLGEPDAQGLAPGALLRYNQQTKLFEGFEEILVFDMNATV